MKRDTPVALRIFVEIGAKLHFTHVALAVGNIGPEPQHERQASPHGIPETGTDAAPDAEVFGLLSRPEGTANLVQGRKRDPGIFFVVGRRRDGNGFLEEEQLGAQFWERTILLGEGEQSRQKVFNPGCGLLMKVIDMPVHKFGHEAHIKELLERQC